MKNTPRVRAKEDEMPETKGYDVKRAVRVLSNGFVDSYAVTWPGGGISGLTYDASCSVATRKALEMGIPLLYETKSGQQ